jgi:lipopolysaccharide export system protein LptA
VIMRLPTTKALLGAALVLGCSGAVAAQPAGQPAQQQSTTMQGIQMNKDQPVRIEAASLEVRDKQRQATFTGDVKLTQGDTTVKCRVLVVFYTDAAAQKKGGAGAQKSDGGSSQQIEKAIAKGDVFVMQKDQTATGENGLFDVKSNTITMTGNVVVTQGSKVMRGDRMVVNMTTGVTTVDSSKGSGPVIIMLTPGEKEKEPAPAPAPPAKAAPPAAKAAPKAPIKIN